VGQAPLWNDSFALKLIFRDGVENNPKGIILLSKFFLDIAE